MEKKNHKILALKYRPKNFKELIGQDIMVQTIVNSIKANKLPNAYLLTGIRGTGKTTTARLIAKALNCNKNFLKEEDCDCNHCEEIANSKHLDVLEMDAASKTGIDDVRELIESSKYNPTSAKYKIFIIDEIHMLSKQAFNGLLKIIEEPPEYLKFIFATTEVKKIPVTIISRCQRFDLHRVPIKILFENLKKISSIEKGKISDKALQLIAKASEGSVRDSLSLLDRALISENSQEKEINEIFIRKMLGIADRSKILELFGFIFEANEKKSLEHLEKMVDEGADPVGLLNDFLEIIYFMIRKKSLGNITSDISISEAEVEMMDKISKDINVKTLAVFWQFILKGIEELSIVSNQILALEMLVVRLLHLKDMPDYQDLISLINKSDIKEIEQTDFLNERTKMSSNLEKENILVTTDQMKNIVQTKSELPKINPKLIDKDIKLNDIKTFEQLIELTSKKREIELKYDLEKNVRLVKFIEGKIDITFNENLGKNFVRNLSEKLFEWTGRRWVITLTKEMGQKTFSEIREITKNKLLENEKKSETYKKFKELFSDGELIEVEKKE